MVAIAGFALAAVVGRMGFPVSDLVVSVAIFAGPWFAAWLISPANIGFGDVKLGAGLGLYLGWLGIDVAFTGFVATTTLAGLAALLMVVLGRRQTLMPFGPALVGGAIVAVALHISGAGLVA